MYEIISRRELMWLLTCFKGGGMKRSTNRTLWPVSVFEIVGPSIVLYPGSICLPQVPLPVNYTAVIGHNATIQVIEAAQHGAALYNVS